MDQLYMHKVLPHIQCMVPKRFFFLFVCHMKFTSPFQFHPPLLFIEYLPTVPYGQVHETTYLLVVPACLSPTLDQVLGIRA